MRPVKEEIRKDRPAGQVGKQVHGVRLGAGDRSYLVRDKQIEVLKNVYGGVQVSFDQAQFAVMCARTASPVTLAAIPFHCTSKHALLSAELPTLHHDVHSNSIRQCAKSTNMQMAHTCRVQHVMTLC